MSIPLQTVTFTVRVESPRDADATVDQFQKFFDYYHPSLKAKVEKRVIEVKPETEDLL